MSQPLPVLFVDDKVVLPAMVVPIGLDDAAQAAVHAAQGSESGKLLIAPRLDDRHPTHGVIASIVQVGRIPGSPGSAAVVRGEQRAHIGTGTSGPGGALWVEVEEIVEPEATDETRALATEYKKLVLAMLQRREAWQIVDYVNGLSDPSALADTAGYASYLSVVQKHQLLETIDVAQRLRVLIMVSKQVAAQAALPAPPAVGRPSALARVGQRAAEAGEQALAMLSFVGETALALAASLAHPARIRWRPILFNICWPAPRWASSSP